MDLKQSRYTETPFVKTKIVATVGPACADYTKLKELVMSGVDVFRLNFAHGEHQWLTELVTLIRNLSDELERPLGILGDLAGPKIRLGELDQGEYFCEEGTTVEFGLKADPKNPSKLTCTYENLISELEVNDRIVLADGSVELRVAQKESKRLICDVNRPGLIRSRQGVNLPGAKLSTPALTEKDLIDLAWALENSLDYIGLSFVRSAEDIRKLRMFIEKTGTEHQPHIIAKIEKLEAIDDLENILQETDAVMVARGDLGVEVDITRVPVLQKHIIKMCNHQRIPVITATQMLDSMQYNEMPTRAEATDIANAVIDGTDAVMLSGETAVGKYPTQAVTMMSRIAHEAERLVKSNRSGEWQSSPRTRALVVTEAVTIAANSAAEVLEADLIVVATHHGRTAMAVSRQRPKVPILALTDRQDTAQRMCLYWGVTARVTDAVKKTPQELLKFVVDWGTKEKILQKGSRLVLVTDSNWSAEGHDLMLVHVIP